MTSRQTPNDTPARTTQARKPTVGQPRNALFLCTGNSARSIMAEAILARVGAGRFNAFSAGSHPKGAVHPALLRMLAARGYDPQTFRSKSWDEFSGPDAPVFDYVITVCDNAAGEVCPVWSGHPVTGHWGMPDPAGAADPETAFEDAWRLLEARISAFCDSIAGHEPAPSSY